MVQFDYTPIWNKVNSFQNNLKTIRILNSSIEIIIPLNKGEESYQNTSVLQHVSFILNYFRGKDTDKVMSKGKSASF